jgi:hypothetical protein
MSDKGNHSDEEDEYEEEESIVWRTAVRGIPWGG